MKNIVLEEQMELGLGSAQANRSAARKNSAPRAGWWFGQMRQLVDKAIERKPRTLPRSHQAYFALERGGAKW